MSELAQALESLSPSESGTKRKRGDEPQTRAKRNRYISIACNECKRRKIKCNGETPCQRCGNLNLECLYAPNCCSSNFKDSNEYKELNAHVTSLQNQIESLLQNLNALRSSLGQDVHDAGDIFYNNEPMRALEAAQGPLAIDPALQGRDTQSGPKQTRFQGPTSSEFSLGLARSSLRTMGISDDVSEGMLSQAHSRAASPVGQTPQPQGGGDLSNRDPIWSLSKEEAIRLCRVYEEEMGLLYPILDIEQVVRHATLLFTFVDAMKRTMNMKTLPGTDAIEDFETDVLKLIIALALVTEGTGRSELGKRIVQSVSKTAENRILGNVSLSDVRILTLISMYHFHTDDEGLSWRVIGLTARLCIELGLHRAETYIKMSNDTERRGALKLFWSIYVLDRRWSFGTGMSFALQDSDIDPELAKPEESQYLTAMISYSKIASKVWKTIAHGDNAATDASAFSKDEISYLDYQAQQWQSNIPESLQYIHPNSPEYARHSSDPNLAGGRATYRLRLILYLRANQMRITIYRPVLHLPNSALAQGSPQFRSRIIEIAKDTIRILTHINQTSDIYRAQQMAFNYFLLSALTVLCLAVSNNPAQNSEECRDEFYIALDLVRGLSANSYVSKRLWKMVRSLRNVGPRLGMRTNEPGNNDNQQQKSANLAQQLRRESHHVHDDAHSSAAVAMAGLAGHPIDESILFSNHNFNNSNKFGTIGEMPVTSPNDMANELTNLFEAAGAFGGHLSGASGSSGHADSLNAMAIGGGQADNANGAHSLMSWNDEELTRIMRDLF